MKTVRPVRDFSLLDVLVVDDDPLMAEFMVIALEALGCQTRCATSGAEALELLDENVDLLVTDWQMPSMDGMELVRRVREEHSPERHLHIVMMTAKEDASARFAALQAGVDAFLYKPVDAVQLELAVATARRNRLLHRRLRRRNELIAAAHARTREALKAVRSDLDAAASLHKRLLPEAALLNGLRITYLYRPALILGGDTIGSLDLGSGKSFFFIVDVCGHGVPAALNSFHLHHRLKGSRPNSPDQLEQVAGSLNREIFGRSDEGYATMVAGVIDAPGCRGWMVRAGHPPPILIRDGTALVLEEGGSLPLGWFPEAPFTAQHFEFPPGARFVIYSDGLTECIDRRGRAFGADDLIRLLQNLASEPLGELVPAIEDVLGLRGSNRAPPDDVSLLAMEHLATESVQL